MVPEAGIEPARLAAGDFESPASTNFTTRADCEECDYDIFLSGFRRLVGQPPKRKLWFSVGIKQQGPSGVRCWK